MKHQITWKAESKYVGTFDTEQYAGLGWEGDDSDAWEFSEWLADQGVLGDESQMGDLDESSVNVVGFEAL